MPRIGLGLGLGYPFYSSIDPAASAYFAATGLTGTTERNAVNTLVTSLKSAGLWSKMKAVYPFVTDNKNLLSYTEDFGNAAWSKGGGTTVTANTTTAPDSTLTADTIVLPNTGTIAQSLTSSSSQTFTFSIYLRASSNTTIKIGFVSPSIVTTCNVTTNWQRFTITYTFSGTTYPQLYNDTGSSVTLFAWGAQAELGSSATTYQPIATTQQSYISNQFKYNLVNPVDSDAAFRLVFNGGWTMSNQGATPNGTNGYADTKLNISNEFTSQTQSFSFYTPVSNTNANVLGGVSNGVSTTQFYNPIGQYNILGTAYVKGSAMSNGFILMSQPSANNTSAYEKGVKLGNFSQTTSALMNFNYYIGARNLSNISDSYANRQYSFAHIGQGLTDTEATALYNAVQTFNTSLSRQV